MKKERYILKTVQCFDYMQLLKSCKLPVIVIYCRPSDYPEHFVARVWDLNQPTPLIMLSKSLEGLRRKLPVQMIPVHRHKSDDPVIVETWI